ncbi:IMPACT family protein [Cognatilysobacter bugurensis]|uniref:YigZ family protein n=1 Tax=Cognatilysobacter bugurensis TaxID=543356 RepID=A0A918STI9_9GAMM|nr:YigZ family protein [Lysobacter bugurensis]GHA70076.1 hypothetical protein GCM10007067_02640 [Lysobacter bugurensis]
MTRDTLAARASHSLEIKHSRFLAQAASVESPDAALAFLAEVSDPAATHNCWAYRIDAQYRSNDDGELAGTAGRPILAAIDGQGFDRVVVVVTRWYGGIKLGAGGLVRAYGGCAAECLRAAPRAPLVDIAEVTVSIAFDDLGIAHSLLASLGATRLDEQYDADGVRLRVALPADGVDTMRTQLRDATRDRARLTVDSDG